MYLHLVLAGIPDSEHYTRQAQLPWQTHPGCRKPVHSSERRCGRSFACASNSPGSSFVAGCRRYWFSRVCRLHGKNEERAQEGSVNSTARTRILILAVQVHVDVRAKLGEISLSDLPLDCLPDGTRLATCAPFAFALH